MMEGRKPRPGIGRDARISQQGLQRLHEQLERGNCPSDVVLAQWIKRYGDAACDLLQRYGIELVRPAARNADTDGGD